MDGLTKATIQSYFEAGMSASEARKFHKSELKNRSDYRPGLSMIDSSINPKDRTITYLYETWRKETQGDRTGVSMLQASRVTTSNMGKTHQIWVVVCRKRLSCCGRPTTCLYFVWLLS